MATFNLPLVIGNLNSKYILNMEWHPTSQALLLFFFDKYVINSNNEAFNLDNIEAGGLYQFYTGDYSAAIA